MLKSKETQFLLTFEFDFQEKIVLIKWNFIAVCAKKTKIKRDRLRAGQGKRDKK